MKKLQLTELQQTCEGLITAYEATWDLERLIEDTILPENKFKQVRYALMQIAGIIQTEMNKNHCNIMGCKYHG
jgi:hypothetical protein